MTTFQQRDGDGVLFPNDRKQAEQQPDYKGSVRLNGMDYEIAGWKKASKAGNPYLSLSVKLKQERRADPPPPQTSPADDFDSDDKLPF